MLTRWNINHILLDVKTYYQMLILLDLIYKNNVVSLSIPKLLFTLWEEDHYITY